MAIYKRILGQHNYNRGRAQNYLNSFLSGSTPRGPYKNMNQSVREAQILDVDLTAFNDDILKLIKKVGDANELRKIIEPAAELVKVKAKVLAPKAKPRKRDNSIKRYFAPKKLRSDVLYTYKTPKVVGNKKAGKGYGRVSGKYGIGNLKASIQVISKVKGYKAPIGIVGPVINRKTSVPNPNMKRHNGWYAHIIYGSSRAFGEKVTYKALRQSTGIVFNIISKGVDRYLSKITPTLKKSSIVATSNEIGKAIYSILSNDATVSASVSTRIFPIVAAQDTAFPFLVYTITNQEPSMTKDGVSPLDTISVQIDCYALEYDANVTLSNAVRSALDFYNGTVQSQAIQRIRFQGQNDGEYDEDLGVFWQSLDFDIRLKRER